MVELGKAAESVQRLLPFDENNVIYLRYIYVVKRILATEGDGVEVRSIVVSNAQNKRLFSYGSGNHL